MILEFLEPDVVLFVHDQALREYGGIQGMRSENLLHSGLARPVNKRAHGSPDLFDLASAYAFGLARNHPFNDGNERTAWGICTLFLKVNGLTLAVGAPDVVARVLDLTLKRLDEVGFAAWLRTNVQDGRDEVFHARGQDTNDYRP